MKRALFILLGVAALAMVLFAVAFWTANRLCVSRVCNATDDLAWLRQEFQLSAAEMARIQKLHEGYLPKCAEMCQKIAAKKQELDAALTGATNVTATVEKKLGELGELRAQCQAQMLRHFAEVSQAMPTEHGKRYYAEMQRLTLGTHEQVEATMSESTAHGHGSH